MIFFYGQSILIAWSFYPTKVAILTLGKEQKPQQIVFYLLAQNSNFIIKCLDAPTDRQAYFVCWAN